MIDVTGADSEIHDLSHSHEDALESCLVSGTFYGKDVTDDERSCDFVNLLAS